MAADSCCSRLSSVPASEQSLLTAQDPTFSLLRSRMQTRPKRRRSVRWLPEFKFCRVGLKKKHCSSHGACRRRPAGGVCRARHLLCQPRILLPPDFTPQGLPTHSPDLLTCSLPSIVWRPSGMQAAMPRGSCARCGGAKFVVLTAAAAATSCVVARWPRAANWKSPCLGGQLACRPPSKPCSRSPPARGNIPRALHPPPSSAKSPFELLYPRAHW